MKMLLPGLVAGTAVLAVGGSMLSPATAAPADGAPSATGVAHRPDNRPGPLTERQDELRTKALALLESGEATLKERRGGGATVRIAPAEGAKGKPGASPEFVEFPVEKSETIWTVLSDFADVSHGSIPEPDRSVDNSTYWEPSFDLAHYEELFNGEGESMKNYYETVSGGRYSVTNEVEDWVTVPGSAASYGANDVEDDGGSWAYINDTVDAWYADQVAAGRTAAEIDTYLRQLDVWDRYDFDGDGDFNEADGYIDHFQAVHAGMGEEAGGGALGGDAIWSHRWYVNATDFGSTGPMVGGTQNKYGGAQIGESGLWIGDYTVEPENGGLGVFAHEYGHDLGLPDYYDTSGGENSTAFWTLMSSGSWLGHGAAAADGIGTTPGLMGPEEKLELGWLDHTEVASGTTSTHTLAPSQESTGGNQALKVDLPDATSTVDYTTPPEGTHAWWSGRADMLNNTLTREVPAGGRVTVSAKAWYDIEAGYDYLYAEYSTDGGQNWTRTGNPIDGSSNGRWAGLRYSYDAAGPSLFRFRYQTDGGVNEAGAFLDQISIAAGGTTFTDGAENGANGWTADGWTISTGSDTKTTSRYYLIENRQYHGYDATLEVGPYNFSEAFSRPDWVEFFSYRPGMLVWYVNDAYADNNVATHPGAGSALPVDAFPEPFTWSDGTRPSNRRQPFDATFGLGTNPETCLHKEVQVGKGRNTSVQTLAACAPQRQQQATFDDSDPEAYWSSANPQGSVKVAGVGVRATVTGTDADGFLTVSVVNP